MNAIPFKLVAYSDPNMEPLDIQVSGVIKQKKQNIHLHYIVSGNIHDIRFPPPSRTARRREELWQTTCFEFFAGPKDKTDYWEYNLSPAGDWAVFYFSDYRKGKMNDSAITSVDIETESDGEHQFKLAGSLPIPAILTGQRLECGISLVLQHQNGGIYYYALDHLKQQPDFHDRNGFMITIENYT